MNGLTNRLAVSLTKLDFLWEGPRRLWAVLAIPREIACNSASRTQASGWKFNHRGLCFNSIKSVWDIYIFSSLFSNQPFVWVFGMSSVKALQTSWVFMFDELVCGQVWPCKRPLIPVRLYLSLTPSPHNYLNDLLEILMLHVW